MQETNKRDSVWHLFAGVLAADLGMLLIGLGGLDALKTETRILIYVGGSLLFLSGLFLIWMDVDMSKNKLSSRYADAPTRRHVSLPGFCESGRLNA
jgi:hypothetical protein